MVFPCQIVDRHRVGWCNDQKMNGNVDKDLLALTFSTSFYFFCIDIQLAFVYSVMCSSKTTFPNAAAKCVCVCLRASALKCASAVFFANYSVVYFCFYFKMFRVFIRAIRKLNEQS